jgi:hypothetical protein
MTGLLKGLPPGDDVQVVGVEEGPVDIEQDSRASASSCLRRAHPGQDRTIRVVLVALLGTPQVWGV